MAADDKREGNFLLEWGKLLVGGVTISLTLMAWVGTNFVSRKEWEQHASVQANDLERMGREQGNYALAEKGTAAALSAVNARLAAIETELRIMNERAVPELPAKVRRGN